MDKLNSQEIAYVVDTNVWYRHIEELKILSESKKIVVTGAVLRELDKHKSSSDKDLAYRSRLASRFIKDNKHKFIIDLTDYNAEELLGKSYSNLYMDNLIVACAQMYGGLISGDLNVQFKGIGLGLEVIDIEEGTKIEEDTYKGFIKVTMTKDEYDNFHDERLHLNEFNLLLNQYLIVEDEETGEAINSFKWDGSFYIHVQRKTLRSKHLGEFVARDEVQACAVDSVLHNQFTMLRGRAGTAKTQIAMSYAMQQLQAGKYSKIIVFSNAIPTANAFYHGLVKGDLQTKLLDSSIGNILASKLGGYDQVEAMLLTEELVILPASDIRGFDSNGMNAIIIITEGQNWTTELLKLAIQRTGEDCKLIIEGDRHTQLDGKQFEGSNNGMFRASEIFKGDECYGEVELQEIYRSRIASLAERMTEF